MSSKKPNNNKKSASNKPLVTANKPITPVANKPVPPIYKITPAAATPINKNVPSGSAPPAPSSTQVLLIGGFLVVAAIAVVVLLLVSNNNNQSVVSGGAATATSVVNPTTTSVAMAGTPASPAVMAPATSVPTFGGEIPVGLDMSAKIEAFPDQGQTHLNPGESVQTLLKVPYNSNPPTSGPHLPNWSNWGIFTKAVPDELQVHNLEHGGVVIQYDCPQGCSNAINGLASYALRYPAQNFTGIMLAPRSGLPDGARLALTVWGKRMLLKTLDRTKIEEFIAANIGKGPEVDPTFKP